LAELVLKPVGGTPLKSSQHSVPQQVGPHDQIDVHLPELKMRIGSIVIHCHEFDRMMAFWQEALHYVPSRPAEGGWVILRDPVGRGPNLSLDRDPKPYSGRRSRLHLDLYAEDQAAEVARLVALGARRYPWRYAPDDDFVVLADPEGNLFCVVQVPPGT
jgi:catechol 2,3-dioxygenase-like lactoylglutathione lyase family enzyme